jgi:hypothetical protein
MIPETLRAADFLTFACYRRFPQNGSFRSGCIAGGAASALVAPAADIIGVKVFAAALAFVSGIISLVTSAFLDEKETAKINEGAARYGELRDRADIFLNSRNRELEEVDATYQRLTEQQTSAARFRRSGNARAARRGWSRRSTPSEMRCRKGRASVCRSSGR